MERAAAVRENKTLARSLPTYINRWATCTFLELILTETTPAFIAPLFGLFFSVSFCLLMHLIHAWLLFKRFD